MSRIIHNPRNAAAAIELRRIERKTRELEYALGLTRDFDNERAIIAKLQLLANRGVQLVQRTYSK